MRPVINDYQKKHSDENETITKFSYDQNSLSIFLKQLNTKSRWHQIKYLPRKKETVLH